MRALVVTVSVAVVGALADFTIWTGSNRSLSSPRRIQRLLRRWGSRSRLVFWACTRSSRVVDRHRPSAQACLHPYCRRGGDSRAPARPHTCAGRHRRRPCDRRRRRLRPTGHRVANPSQASDALTREGPLRIFLVGWYGVPNLGDEAIFDAIDAAAPKVDARITAFSTRSRRCFRPASRAPTGSRDSSLRQSLHACRPGRARRGWDPEGRGTWPAPGAPPCGRARAPFSAADRASCGRGRPFLHPNRPTSRRPRRTAQPDAHGQGRCVGPGASSAWRWVCRRFGRSGVHDRSASLQG